MKTLRISQKEGREGLNFDSMESIVAFEAKLEGRVIFVVEEGSNIEKSISKAAERSGQDYDHVLPALKGAAVRKLEEEDFELVRIMKLRAIPTLLEDPVIQVKLNPVLLSEEVADTLNPKKGS